MPEIVVRKGNVKNIGLVVPGYESFSLPYFSRAIQTAKAVTIREGYQSVLYTEKEIIEKTRVNKSVGNPLACDGVAVFSPYRDWDQYLEVIAGWGIPCALIRRKTGVKGVVTLNDSDVKGTSLAMEYLCSLGHKIIGHVGRWSGEVVTNQRKETYQRILKDKGLVRRDGLLYGTDGPPDGEMNFNNWVGPFRDWVKKLMSPPDRPTGFFCHSDEEAVYLMNELWQCGRRIPDDVSVVGYDNSLAAERARPPLTTVNVPIEEMCEVACLILMGRAGEEHTGKMELEFENKLIIRGSCDYA